jgi:hypothetical protein
MRQYRFFSQCHFLLGSLSLILVFILSTLALKAQTPTNYSGKWQFDKAKSTPDKIEPDYDGTIILIITQNSTTITSSEIYKHPERSDWETAKDLYQLNGKEQVRKSSVGTNKRLAKWSEDKKVLSITNLDTQTLKGVLQDFLVIDTYKLSEDGKILTIERYRKNPVNGETNAQKVYNKL